MAHVEVVAHRTHLRFRPVEFGAAAAMIDALLQLIEVGDQAVLAPVQHAAVAAGDAGMAGYAMRLMYTFRLERERVLPERQAERRRQQYALPDRHA